MSGTVWALLVVAAAAAVADWVAVATHRKPLEYGAKPTVLAAIAAAAVVLTPTDPTRRAWFVAAFVASLVGDIALMLPRNLFVAGLGSFLAAHVCFIVGLRHGGRPAAAFAVAVVAAALVAAWPAGRILAAVRASHRPLTAPVAVYMAVIAVMVAAAAVSGSGLALAGAALFFASDATLGWNRFVRPLRSGPLVVMVTYHLAQMLLVASLVR